MQAGQVNSRFRGEQQCSSVYYKKVKTFLFFENSVILFTILEGRF
jgi:hypothetical protein